MLQNAFTVFAESGIDFSCSGDTVNTDTTELPIATDGKLTKSTYGNGDYVQYVYDSLGRIVGQKNNGVLAFTQAYDGNGYTSTFTDIANNLLYSYEYDSLGRLLRSTQKKNGSLSLVTGTEYDNINRVNAKV